MTRPLMAALAALACSNPSEPRGERQIGFLDLAREAAIVVPDTVAARQQFEIRITTIGLTSCWSSAATIVEPGSVVRITPYDSDFGRVNCFPAEVDIVHTAAFTFDQPGQLTVTIRGRDRSANAQIVEVRREVVVR